LFFQSYRKDFQTNLLSKRDVGKDLMTVIYLKYPVGLAQTQVQTNEILLPRTTSIRRGNMCEQQESNKIC
jgi:hypothetical protein